MAFLTARLSSYASFRAVQESDKTFQPRGKSSAASNQAHHHKVNCNLYAVRHFASYRPPAFSIALIMILLASSPERFVTVKCATDCRRRVFFFASTAISVICIATRGALRSMILMSLSFCLAKISPPQNMASLCHRYEHFNPSCFLGWAFFAMGPPCLIFKIAASHFYDMDIFSEMQFIDMTIASYPQLWITGW